MNLTQWLDTAFAQAANVGTPVCTVRLFRVSSAQAEVLSDNAFRSLVTAQDSDAEVTSMREIGSGFLARDQHGEALRAQHGALDLRMDMLQGAQTSRALLGHLVVIGPTLFVFISSTAATSNVNDAERNEDRGNAAVKTLREVIWAWANTPLARSGTQRLKLYVAEPTRLCRDRQHAGNFIATAREHAVIICYSGRKFDMTVASDWKTVSENLIAAAQERDAIVGRHFNAKAAALLQGGLPEAVGSFAPFTHEQAVITIDDGHGGTRDIPDAHRIVPKADAGPKLAATVRAIIDAAADIEDETGEYARVSDIARAVAGPHELFARGSKVANLSTPILITALNDPGQALRLMFGPRYVTAWRTGILPWHASIPIDDPEILEQVTTTTKDEHGNDVYEFSVDCPIPEGLDVTDDEWDQLAAILAPHSQRAGRPWTGERRPFRSTRWSEDGVHYEMSLKRTNLYTLFETSDPTGSGTATKIISVNAQRVNHALGEALIALATELEAGQVPVTVPKRGPSPRASANDARRRHLEDEIAGLEKSLRGTVLLQTTAAADGDTEKLGVLTDVERDTRIALDAARSSLAALATTAEPAPDGTRETTISLASLEEVGTALMTMSAFDGTVPPELVAATKRLTGRSLWVRPHGTGARCTITVHLACADGTMLHRNVHVDVPASTRGATATHHVDLITEARMWDGRSWEAIGTQWGIDGTGKTQSFTVFAMKAWLKAPTIDGRPMCKRVGSADLRRVILWAPDGVQRALFGVLAGRRDILLAEGYTASYLDHLEATYTNHDARWSETWIGLEHTSPRALLDLLATTPLDQGMPAPDVARTLSRSIDDVVGWGGTRTMSGRRPDSPRRPPILNRSWRRTERPPLDERRLLLKRCPHQDCPGRGPNGRSTKGAARATPLTHVLWVPEIPDALVCPDCRRMPSDRATVFPELYLRRWNKGKAKSDTNRARTIDEST